MDVHATLAMFNSDEFDLVLLNIQLLDMIGLDVARKLRERYAGRPMPLRVALAVNVLKNK